MRANIPKTFEISHSSDWWIISSKWTTVDASLIGQVKWTGTEVQHGRFRRLEMLYCSYLFNWTNQQGMFATLTGLLLGLTHIR